MATLLAQAETEVGITYAHFLIEDRNYDVSFAPEPVIPEGADWLTTQEDQIFIGSESGLYHFPAVVLQWWDAAPEWQSDKWETCQEEQVRLSSGRLLVKSALGEPVGAEFVLGAPGEYICRAYSRGRVRIHEELRKAGGSGVHGVEQYLIQFWSKPDVMNRP